MGWGRGGGIVSLAGLMSRGMMATARGGWRIGSHILESVVLAQVVVLYRSVQKRKATSKKASKRAQEDRMKDILGNRNMHLRMFHDIAMADLDQVFPDKKVGGRAQTLLCLARLYPTQGRKLQSRG